eukprot:TRINITY_DN1313_c0_g1_i1.p1 TRINITY_DN1313_c0_g1~~TRINITY_DN1313_c0_g1_i1.p1  ORF type:complete len:496 (+),score=157.61 TRINITY_DN1313_c0_g1_i1:91-1578(+)
MNSKLFLVVFVALISAALSTEVAKCYSHETIKLTTPEKPGFTTSFSQNGLNYAKSVGLDILQKDLASIQIPQLNGTAKVSLVGQISYLINSIKINSLQFQQSNIQVVPGVGLKISISQANAVGSLGWHYREKSWPHIQGTGTADLKVQLTADILLELKSVQNHLQLSKSTANVQIQKLDVNLHGKGSWFYQFFFDVLHRLIVNEIQSAVQNAMQTSILTGVNDLLMKVPVRQEILKPVIFDIGLVRDPLFQQNSFTLFEAGDSYDADQPTDCPADVCPQRDLPTNISQRMATMYLSDYVPTSLAFAMIQAHELSYVVEPSVIPPSSPFKLNTNSLAGMCPPLFSKYPNRNVSLLVSLTGVPKIVFSSAGCNIPSAPVSIEFYVELDTTKVLAFTLAGNLNTSATALLNGWTLSAKIGPTSGTWSISQTNIGPVDVKPLSNLMKFAIAFGIPTVNSKLSAGIQLPTVPGLQFLNPSLKWGQDYLSVETDLQYTSPN